MSWRQAKTPGWAAFDLQRKQRQCLDPSFPAEPFPSLSNPTNPTTARPMRSYKVTRNNDLQAKPFASVILRSVDSSPLCEKPFGETSEASTSSCQHNHKVPASDKSDFIKLKDLYSWASDSLVKDVLAAVDGDYGKASAALKAMVSEQNLVEYEETQIGHSCCSYEETQTVHSSSSFKDFSLDNDILRARREFPDPCAVIESCHNETNNKLMSEIDKFGNDSEDMKLILSAFAQIPIEPEWEDDDVYLTHRKDALKTVRTASRHSKAAVNAFMRGDHSSARQLSAKAREEWSSAEKLNEKASHEILRIRNSENSLWKLDLHGLHASEAVAALQKWLHEIESQDSLKGSLYPDSARVKAHPSNLSSCNGIEKLNEQASLKQTPMMLEVITGIGKHSRGAAALPGAVRSFLVENSYRFDEARPGVIFVRPKFRRC